MARKFVFVGTGALVCAVASFTFFLSISRDWAPCGEFFSREGPCPPHIPVLGADLTPQQTVVWSIVLGVVVGGLLGYFLLWATSRRRGERVVGFVTLGLVTGAAAGAFYGYHQEIACMPDGDICVGSFKVLFDRFFTVPVAIALYAIAGLFVGATFGWVLGRLMDRGSTGSVRTV